MCAWNGQSDVRLKVVYPSYITMTCQLLFNPNFKMTNWALYALLDTSEISDPHAIAAINSRSLTSLQSPSFFLLKLIRRSVSNAAGHATP